MKNVKYTFPSSLSQSKFSPAEKIEFVSAFFCATFILRNKKEIQNIKSQFTH